MKVEFMRVYFQGLVCMSPQLLYVFVSKIGLPSNSYKSENNCQLLKKSII